MHAWRRALLRCFGASIADGVNVYPSVRIWAPWNLQMGSNSGLGPHVDCYCVDEVTIGHSTTVSQYSYLCTASHDYCDPSAMQGPYMPLVSAPIELGNRVWVTADVFIGPGVTVGDGAVVLARATVTRDLPPWTVAQGNPATVVRARVLRSRDPSNQVHTEGNA
jgi:putative colanic acid biosynthesis acetyltransferase WcaF